ncbi:hypothetical protein Asi02nite_00790 [Asanoa siamensis]|uniref:Uncharacterized protein n=1 Tax=Asanoa siamensis TaxID=926357 RepID=A0ABQ4CGZ3_9ACTN|nr:hypothetical protein Asi02nite_00790 [Asanoa siamensis]
MMSVSGSWSGITPGSVGSTLRNVEILVTRVSVGGPEEKTARTGRHHHKRAADGWAHVTVTSMDVEVTGALCDPTCPLSDTCRSCSAVLASGIRPHIYPASPVVPVIVTR